MDFQDRADSASLMELPASLMKLPDSASVGPMGPLLRQLDAAAAAAAATSSIGEPRIVGILELKEKLEKLEDPLKGLYKAEDPGHTGTWWMKEVRDLCHEIKDYYDEPARLQTACDFTGFIARVQDLTERRTSLQLAHGFNQVATPDVTLHLPMPAAPIEDLDNLLAVDDKTAKTLRVVTLFGFAGAQNTKAARDLYDRYGGRFQCQAFVRVSRNPDRRSLLTSIHSQIKAPPDDGFSDVNDLILSIKNHLHNKRYLIIIDDLWTIPERNFIMGAFPGGYCHSRIIATTQIKEVALASSDYFLQNIFEMTPLNDEQWGRNPTHERLKEELNRIYDKLAPELKTCLLYLNMYQAGCTIRKDDLVMQWMAEGFLLSERKNEKLAGFYFDELVRRELILPVEKNCNDEVISCTVDHMVLDMIANKSEDVNFITILDCSQNIRFYDKVRRLSVQFRGEVNTKIPRTIVVTNVRSLVFSGFYGCVPSLVECKLLKVLILHIWADGGDATLDLSGISELFLLKYVKIACNTTIKLPDKIQPLQYLETLEVDAKVAALPSDITSPPGLLHLSLPSADLPTDVCAMKYVRTLGCVDISRYSEENMVKLFRLITLEDLHLTCSKAPEALEEKMDVLLRSIFSPHPSLRSVDLVPTVSYTDDPGASSIISISCDSFSNNVPPGAASASSSSSVLERLELSPRICIFSGIPNMLAQFGQLCILKIAVKELSWGDIDILKEIPALTALSLYVWITPADGKKSIGKDGFRALTYFKFTCTSQFLEFLPHAMASVGKLKLRFNASRMEECSLLRAGLGHLAALKEISVKIGTDGSAHASDTRDLECALESDLKTVFQKHPIRAIMNVQVVDHFFGADNLGRVDSRSYTSSESSSYESPLGEGACHNHHKEAKRILVYIVGHKNYKLIQREREQMTMIIEGNKEDNQGVYKEKWVMQLQELVYDIEDFEYNLSRLRIISSLTDIVGRMKHLQNRINTLRNWQHAAQWSQIGDSSAAAAMSAPFRYQTSPCYTPEWDDLVGIDEPKTELLQLMAGKDGQLRVVCIVGCSGLGKSTLARAAYAHLVRSSNEPGYSNETPSTSQPRYSTRFDCFAWVVASDCNSSRDLLKKIAQQLAPDEARNTISDDNLLRKTLRLRRCFIVIDQVQREEVWYGIEDAFPKCNTGSRIIVTTSIQSVANAAATKTCSTGSYIYTMKGLGDADSRKLFWKKFYGCVTEPAPVLAAGSEHIFKKCDGLPLSLICMARNFREHHQTGRIERFGGYMGAGQEAHVEMNNALAQCYSSLPDNGHRVCLLSLSIFPQGHEINRKSLIRRWVAEGLVTGDGVRNAVKVAADRFNELVNRNIIEPVLLANNSRVKRCRVHGLMLDFIVSKAISKNFVTLIRKDETIPNKQDNLVHGLSALHNPLVRRLSVQDGTEESATEIGLSVIRSLTLFKSVVFNFRSCKLLRVLDLEGCKGTDNAVIDAVCHLPILTYLSLRGSDVRRIPRRIRRLQYLETLDLRETEVEILPIEVILLPWLAHLFGQFHLPPEHKLGKKKSKVQKFLSEKSRLQTLSGFVMEKNSVSESIMLDARYLRKVKIWCKRYSTISAEDLLVSSLKKRFTGSSALESLSIDLNKYAAPGFLHSLEAPCKLNSMKLTGKLGKLPDFITSPETTLRELQLSSTGLSSKELSLLQKLPWLVYLELYEDDQWGIRNGIFPVDEGGFPSLERLCFEASSIPELHIQGGAMTKLTSLHLLCPEYPPSRVKGVEHLQRLNEVVLHDSLEGSELEIWRKMSMEHENRPRVTKRAASS